MTEDHMNPVLETARARFAEILRDKNMLGVEVSVLAKPLTPEEAIGTPGRRDFPIVLGVERVIEASLRGSKGHAFTDSASEFVGRIEDVLALPLDTNRNRAIFLATLNAALSHLGMASGTVHCKDDDPEKCAEEISEHLLSRCDRCTVGLIGLNPAIAEGLVRAFGADAVRITDRSPETIGKSKFGVEVWDAGTRTEEIVRESDVILVTGTTLANGTFDQIRELASSQGKDCIVYGVTGAGVCELVGIERICPYGSS